MKISTEWFDREIELFNKTYVAFDMRKNKVLLNKKDWDLIFQLMSKFEPYGKCIPEIGMQFLSTVLPPQREGMDHKVPHSYVDLQSFSVSFKNSVQMAKTFLLEANKIENKYKRVPYKVDPDFDILTPLTKHLSSESDCAFKMSVMTFICWRLINGFPFTPIYGFPVGGADMWIKTKEDNEVYFSSKRYPGLRYHQNEFEYYVNYGCKSYFYPNAALTGFDFVELPGKVTMPFDSSLERPICFTNDDFITQIPNPQDWLKQEFIKKHSYLPGEFTVKEGIIGMLFFAEGYCGFDIDGVYKVPCISKIFNIINNLELNSRIEEYIDHLFNGLSVAPLPLDVPDEEGKLDLDMIREIVLHLIARCDSATFTLHKEVREPLCSQPASEKTVVVNFIDYERNGECFELALLPIARLNQEGTAYDRVVCDGKPGYNFLAHPKGHRGYYEFIRIFQRLGGYKNLAWNEPPAMWLTDSAESMDCDGEDMSQCGMYGIKDKLL